MATPGTAVLLFRTGRRHAFFDQLECTARSLHLEAAARRGVEHHAACICAMDVPVQWQDIGQDTGKLHAASDRLRATLAEADAALWLQRLKPPRRPRDIAIRVVPAAMPPQP